MQPCLVEGSATRMARIRSRYRDTPPPTTSRVEQPDGEVFTFRPQVSRFTALYIERHRAARPLQGASSMSPHQNDYETMLPPTFDVFGVRMTYRLLKLLRFVVNSVVCETIFLPKSLDIDLLGMCVFYFIVSFRKLTVGVADNAKGSRRRILQAILCSEGRKLRRQPYSEGTAHQLDNYQQRGVDAFLGGAMSHAG